ncbi:hypothetical protein ACIOHE_14020 [Streptomyces sp. NPDC087851]|uniref:hypothetical protein n=1 Tax=Streptomyces sp. NPDC087851 TaxID=3365810 RepID=UPI003801611E
MPFVVALALGLWGIGRQGTLWGDEAVTYDMAHRDPARIWHTAGTIDAVHGLYYLFMHAVLGLWDGGPAALRLPSVLAVAAAAAGVARIGHRLAGPRAGLPAGLVLPLLPVVQRYAQEGRSYALVCALATWATWLLLTCLARPTRSRWTGYAAVTLTACLLHEFAVLVLLSHGVTVFLSVRFSGLPRSTARAWGVAAGCVTAGVLPLAVFSTTQAAQVNWIGGPGVREVAAFAGVTALGLVLARVVARRPARGADMTGGGVGKRDGEGGGYRPSLPALALPLLILPTVLLMLMTPVRPLYVDRYVLFSSVGLALLAGAALAGARRAVAWGAALVALAALVPVTLHLRTPESRQNDVVAVARAVERDAERGDGLLFMPSRRRVWTFVRPESFRGLTDLALERSPEASDTLYGRELPPERIRERVLSRTRIVTVHDLAGEPLDGTAQEEMKRATLRTYFEECGPGRRVTQAVITVYARPGAC